MPTEFVTVNISTQLTGISREGFGLGLIFDNANDFPYTLVEGTEDIPAAASQMVNDMVARAFSQNPSPNQIAIYGVDVAAAGTSISTELDGLITENDDWYFLLLASRSQADIEEAASWGTANGKFPIFQADITLDVATITSMGTNISDEVVLYAHDGGVANEDPFMDAAALGKFAPLNPGTLNWAIQQFNGIAKATYSNTEFTTLDDNDINTMIGYKGVDITSNGIATDGTFADIIRGRDWLKARIEENVFFILLNNDVVPYSNDGIAQIVGGLRKSLKVAFDRGVILGDYTIDSPLREEISDNDKANRILPDVNWTATVSGAINTLTINGVLQV